MRDFDLEAYLAGWTGVRSFSEPGGKVALECPADLLTLAMAYECRGDMASALRCVHALIVYRHPEAAPADTSPVIELGPIPAEWTRWRAYVPELREHFNAEVATAA